MFCPNCMSTNLVTLPELIPLGEKMYCDSCTITFIEPDQLIEAIENKFKINIDPEDYEAIEMILEEEFDGDETFMIESMSIHALNYHHVCYENMNKHD